MIMSEQLTKQHEIVAVEKQFEKNPTAKFSTMQMT